MSEVGSGNGAETVSEADESNQSRLISHPARPMHPQSEPEMSPADWEDAFADSLQNWGDDDDYSG